MDHTRHSRRHALKIMAASALASTMPAPSAAKAATGPFSQYDQFDALGLAQLVRKGEISPIQLLDSAIARAEAVNPRINALSHRLYDHGRQVLADGVPDGPFAGVPFLLKDLHVHLAGQPLSNGSRAFADYVSAVTSVVTKRYRRAGLVVFGRTTSPEFGLTATTESVLYGDTRNPWDLTRTAGGSSGGAAAAVAAGILPIAQASDGGGSIRTPASCCGLFGMKPSRGRVPMGPGRTEGWNGLSTIHAVSRSVRDNAALLDATAGPEPGSRYVAPPPERPYLKEVARPPEALRIALMISPPSGTPVDADCEQAARDAAALCEDLGHHVEEAGPDVDPAALGDGMLTIIAVETARLLDDRAAVLGRPISDADVEPVTLWLYQYGKTADPLAYARASGAFQKAAIAVAEFMADYDVILSPTLAKPPVKLGLLSLSPADFDAYVKEVTEFGPYTGLYNMTGQPAMSVPLYWTDGGLPVGTMFVGRYGDEATLYRLAGQLEAARPWADRRPPL